MRLNSNLGAAVVGALIVSAALPALAAGKHFAKAGKKAEKIEMKRANVAINGVIVTGPAWATGRAESL
jgi:type IV secretory pathway VirB2 component (pilin)